MENGEIRSTDDKMSSSDVRQYRPAVSHEGSAVQMTSKDPGPPEIPLKKLIIPSRSENVEGTNNFKRESKLELFGFDSLVNKLGLKSMTGEYVATPMKPREREDTSITLESSKVAGPKFGTMMGVFVPCLQNILGIIYYIRFSCELELKPQGKVTITVVRANDLKNQELVRKSDPCVVFYVRPMSKVKTEVVDNNLSPLRNETFEVLVEDKEILSIIFEPKWRWDL